MAWANSTRNKRNPPGWTTTRTRILRRDHHTCQIQWDDGCTRTATEIDDIIPTTNTAWIAGDANLQAACHHCNQRKNIAQRPHKRSERRAAVPHPGLAES